MRYKGFLTYLIFSFITVCSVNSQVVINEYSCSNISSFTDNFGNYEDWIELYNTTASPVVLNGWYMSDRKNNPTKWQIGTATIPANSFLLIWASGRDINSGTLHAGFKLTQCKPEAIVLANSSGNIIDSLTLRPTLEGHSRGRTTNGASTWSVFLSPTPNASNTNPYQDYAARPVMSIPAGFYTTAQTVGITSATPGATIRYTTDGSLPTTTSTIYSGPINISATTVLRATAFSPSANIPNSFVESNTYFINEPHTVAVVSIFGDDILTLMSGTSFDPYVGLEYFDENGVFKTESYGNANKHGNDSWSYPQRGIDFISHDGYGYNYALLDQIFNSKPRTEFQHLILKAAANDNYPFETPGSAYAWGPSTQLGSVHIRDAYVQTLSQKAELHLDERTWSPCVLYVNGQYWGVYDAREKVDDADFTEYYYNTPEDSLQMLKTWGSTWSEYGGAQAQTDWNNLATFITTNNMAVQANYNYVDSLYNTKSLADYVILNSFVVCSDWLNWNTEWWRGLNQNAAHKKWRYCLWDEDATFGHYIDYTGVPSTATDADPCDPLTLGDPGGEGHVPILNALLQNQNYYQYFIMRYFDLLNGPLNCARIIDILDSMVNVIQPEMQEHINKWGGSYSDWWANYQTLRTFIQARCDSVVQQFVDCWPVTGPFPIKVNVSPPGSGMIDLNSLYLTSFVWSGIYPGNMNILLTAHPDSSYCFDYWEFQNHTPLPSINDSSISFLLTMSDSIVAHFSNSSTLPVISAVSDSICIGDSTTLQVNSGSSFAWAPAAGLSCTNCPNPVVTPSSTTTYTVTVTGTCVTGTADITITVLQPSVSTPTVTATYTNICIGDTTALQANSGSTYAWSPATGLSCTDCANPLATPITTTTYNVTVTGNCSSGSADITISIVPPPVLSISGDTSICPSHSIQIFASGGTYYSWSPSLGLSCTNCSSPVASPIASTTYYVTVSNGPGAGCRDSDSLIVTITDDCPELYIPNGFSPNGDNNNDVYYIYGDIAEFEIVIYNRWGQIVYESHDQKKGWDGTYNGNKVQSGIYAYKLTITDFKGTKTQKTGNITLVR